MKGYLFEIDFFKGQNDTFTSFNLTHKIYDNLLSEVNLYLMLLSQVLISI